jgi:2',3'-cyclic-nucleotide 2'-phosphodiesterase (5'-nucleotidase family)
MLTRWIALVRSSGICLQFAIALAMAPSVSAAGTTVPLTILHTADLHARLLPDDQDLGGFARLATGIQRERARSKGALVLCAGDLVQGTPVSTLYEGRPIFELANLLSLDVFTLGNHDFDYGWQRIENFKSIAEFEVVTANVHGPDGQPVADGRFAIRTVNGVRVGVIGAMTADLPGLIFSEQLLGCQVLPVLESVRAQAAILREKTDLIVVLGHLNADEEQALLSEAPEIAVIVSGHTHAPQKPPREQSGRVLVRAGAYGRELGRLDLEVAVGERRVASWKWTTIPINSDLAPSMEMQSRIAEWERKVAPVVDVRLASSTRRFDRAEVKALMERALREELNCDFGFANIGGVRDVLPEGEILARHIWNIMPFHNKIVLGRFKGSQLPPSVVGGQAIEPDREYTLATSDYTAEKQEREMLTRGLKFEPTGRLLRELLMEWVSKQKVLSEELLR